MKRIPRCARLACLILVAACGDAPTLVEKASSLQFVLPSSDSYDKPPVDTSSRIVPLDSRELLGASDGARMSNVTANATTDVSPLLRNLRTTASFGMGPATPFALVEGTMEFLGTSGEQTVFAELLTLGGELLTRTQVFYQSGIAFQWYQMSSQVRIQLSANCGYALTGQTGHKASTNTQSAFPYLPPTILTVADNSNGNQSKLEPCKSTIETVTGTGGQGDTQITQSWYLCTWSVWYDAGGVEIRREFLGCVPI